MKTNKKHEVVNHKHVSLVHVGKSNEHHWMDLVFSNRSRSRIGSHASEQAVYDNLASLLKWMQEQGRKFVALGDGIWIANDCAVRSYVDNTIDDQFEVVLEDALGNSHVLYTDEEMERATKWMQMFWDRQLK